MAITDIHPIKVTLGKAIDYCVSDKEDENKEGKIHKTLISALNCSIQNATAEFEKVKEIHRQKTRRQEGNLAYHVVQSFEGVIPPELANEVGRRLAEECFGSYQCVISTHTNTDSTHNHIVFNAWQIGNGKKYHDCTAAYAEIRRVSDRLCEEYGLPVLEHTKDFKLVKYTDHAGKIKHWEPTERKIAIRKGMYSNTNDYRNYDKYAQQEALKKSNREVIKEDIDKLLPFAQSYEDLLLRLKDLGYVVRDKKVNGEWLSHIAFKAPTKEKFTRDYKIGDEYTRERLTEIINGRTERNNALSKANAEPSSRHAEYEYGKINVESIDENYREQKSGIGNSYMKVPRSELEKLIIADVKRMNKQMNMEYKALAQTDKERPTALLKNKKHQYFLNRINANLRALNFVEKKNIQSFVQIDEMISLLKNKRDSAQSEIDKNEFVLKKVNESIAIIAKVDTLREKISNGVMDENYILFEKQKDLALLKSYESILNDRNLGDEEKQRQFRDLCEKYNAQFKKLALYMKTVNEQLTQYEDCAKTLQGIEQVGGSQITGKAKQYNSPGKKQSYDKNQDDR